jgi:hypothetical protein
MQSTKQYIDFIQSADETACKDFVLGRLNELENQSKNDTQEILANDFKKGFIGKETEIHAGEGTDLNLFIDDDNLYLNFANFIKTQNVKNIFSLLTLTQKFVSDLFGQKGNAENRLNKYSSFFEVIGQEQKTKVSIKDFYGNNTAECLERSAAAQNLLSFIGVDTTLVNGKLKTNDKDELHAFNLIENKGEKILFDVTNPIYFEKDGKTCSAPYIFKLNGDNHALLNNEKREYCYPPKLLETIKTYDGLNL